MNNKILKKSNKNNILSSINFIGYNNEFIKRFEKLLLSNEKEYINLKEMELYYNIDTLNLIKLLYYNRNKISEILNEVEQKINVDKNISNLPFNFYLSLLINKDIYIDYSYTYEYINQINQQKSTMNINDKYKSLLMSKIIIDLIKHYNTLDDEDIDYNTEVENINNENLNIIKNNINIFEDLNLKFKQKEIESKYIYEIYFEIIKALLINIKNKDIDYIINIINQLYLDQIDLIEIILNGKNNILNEDENYIKEYLILKEEDLLNEKKINFYYIILKYILNNNSIYIYQFKFLLATRNIILKLINFESNIFVSMNSNIKNKFDDIVKIISDSDYYVKKYKVLINKKNKEKAEKIDNITNSSESKESNGSFFNSFDSEIKNSSNKKSISSTQLNQTLKGNSTDEIINNISSNSSLFNQQINYRYNNTSKNLIDYLNNNSFFNLLESKISKKDKEGVIESEKNYQMFKYIKIIGNNNSPINKKNNEQKEYIKTTNNINKNKLYTSDYIEEINNGFIIWGINNQLIIYNVYYEKVEVIPLNEYPINIFEIENNNENIIIVCMKKSMIYFNLKDNLKEITTFKIKDLNNSNNLYSMKLNKNSFFVSYQKEIIIYSEMFSNIVAKTITKKIKLESVKGGIKFNDYTILKVCNFFAKENNELYLYINDNNYKKIQIKNSSLIYSSKGLAVMPRYKNKILLCACKKYFKFQKNGILLINIDDINNNIINNNFYETRSFEIYCFCPFLQIKSENTLNICNKNRIIDTDYFLVGGFNTKKHKGVIQLYKVSYDINNNNNTIEYIQDINFQNNNNHNFKGFNQPISSIIQDIINEDFSYWCKGVRWEEPVRGFEEH